MAGRAESIYVEIEILGPLDQVWMRTQTPDHHQQWDLRFSEICYLPRRDATEPQRFLYSTRIGFGLHIRGEGESVGSSGSADKRASALKFWSHDPKSLIHEGSGYWKYAATGPGGSATRFLTRYDYEVRFGVAGRLVDRWVFRPLIGWATAWSFIDVNVTNKTWGGLFGYSGSFEVQWLPMTADQIPGRVRPRREERRE